MNRLVCLFLALVMLVSTAGAAVGERVELPQDGGKWYVTLFGDPSDSKFHEVRSWFSNHDGLRSFRDQCHWNVITTTSGMYRDRYRKSIPVTPCVRVQRPDGTPLYESAGPDLPLSAAAMHNGITEQCIFNCRPKPQPSPPPEPVQPAATDPEPQKLSDGGPPEPEQPTVPWWLYGALFSGGSGFGVYQQWRDTHSG